ncbi:unnamed protein product [Nippostrongylus brasiliensis]|uniref:DnaJ-X domain-containing protein n=1 Tax=Nippostrongylus brasiliensis TaxID=27835 RepID=A0A0N4YB58_NIPBR|nr:unnamed protein product [Nippostrongylus brasiliensis]
MQCAYKERSNFCRHVKEAYQKNREAMRHLKAISPRESARLRHANRLLRMAMNVTEKENLPGFLYKALHFEVTQLTQLIRSCNKRNWDSACTVALTAVVQATTKMVEAIKDVATGNELAVATKAYQEYLDGVRHGNQTSGDLGVKLGKTIVNAFYRGD